MIKTLAIAGITIAVLIWIDNKYNVNSTKAIETWWTNNRVSEKAQQAAGTVVDQVSKATKKTE